MKNHAILLLFFILPVLAMGQLGRKRDSLDYYKYLAQAEFDMVGDYASAVYYMTKAIKLDPKDFELYELRAFAKDYLGDNQGVESDCSIVLQLDPGNIYAYVGRAYARMRMKKYAEAIQDFDFLVQTEPNYAGYYIDRGHCKLGLKELDAACADFKQGSELGSADAYRTMMDYCFR